MEMPEREIAPGLPASTQPDTPPGHPGGLRALRSWARDLFFCMLALFFFGLFFYQPVRVEGGSMEPGLEDQERIFINRLVYRLENIERGDIVVFRYPRDTSKSFIKRVIGLPGDRVRIDFGRVYLNGLLVPESYVPLEYRDSGSHPESVVPANSYFVLGDHRSSSNDSRAFGPVLRSYIYGKAVFGYWPVEKVGILH